MRGHRPIPFLGGRFELAWRFILEDAEMACMARRVRRRVVVGGGNAGCAAAIAAARHGARTLLVERYGFLGGTATAAMVGPWMTFHSGEERIVGGIAEEIVERLMRKGASPGHLPDSSDYVATITPFDPEVHKALLFEMMREAGVALLLHAYFLAAELDGVTRYAARRSRRSAAARTCTRNGRDRCDRRRAGCRVGRRADAAGRRARSRAAGDADVPVESCRSRRDWRGTCASIPRRCAARCRRTHARRNRLPPLPDSTRFGSARATRAIVDVPRELVSFFISPYPDEVTVNMTRVVDIDPLDPDDLTRAEVESRLQAMQLFEFFRQCVPGFENARIAATGDAGRHPRVAPNRRTVHAHARRRSASAQVRRRGCAQRLSDRSSTIPPAAERRRTGSRRARATRFPTAALVPVNREQLLVAGRCISTTHEALASTRLTPTVMTLGQAAGTAAALACARGVRVGDIDVRALREQLRADGVLL